MPKIPRYSGRFKHEAVELLRCGGRPIPHLASELGCSPQSLRNWGRQIVLDTGRAPGLSSDERDESRRLRRELRVVTEEREILKKPRSSPPRSTRPGDGLRVHRREEGTSATQLTRTGGAWPAWSPDGTAIAFERAPCGSADAQCMLTILTMSATGTSPRTPFSAAALANQGDGISFGPGPIAWQPQPNVSRSL